MICSKCGKENSNASAFCVQCGNPLHQAPPQAQQAPPQAQQAPPPVQQPAPIVQNIYQRNETVTMGEWFVTFLLLCIPIVGIVMMFVWAFSSDTKPSKANLFKLYLLLAAIGAGLAIIIGIIMIAVVGSFWGL